MVRGLILGAAALAASCATAPDAAPPQAMIAEDVVLTLPAPPGYPETRSLMQTVRARYGERDAAFEAVVSLAPEQVEIVLTVLGGPRLATIHWDGEGVREERSPLAPEGVPTENILADLFLATWPADAVTAALPAGVTLVSAADGGRSIRRGKVVLVDIVPDPADAARRVVRNRAFGYEVTIVSRDLD